jgi:hypothetical protein
MITLEVNSKRRLIILLSTILRLILERALERVAKVIPENATIICDYIIAEQTQMNIKESTKEGKIKVLTWLSNYFQTT